MQRVPPTGPGLLGLRTGHHNSDEGWPPLNPSVTPASPTHGSGGKSNTWARLRDPISAHSQRDQHTGSPAAQQPQPTG